jgi:hypothetical protein
MMTVSDDNGGGQRRHTSLGGELQLGKTRAGGKRWRRQPSGNDGWGSRRGWQWMMKAKADDDGGGQQQHTRLGGVLQWGRMRAGGKQRH